MPEVIAHVITAEGKHGHWVTPYSSDRAGRRRGSFRAHRRSDVNAGAPIERLENQRHRGCPAPAKNDGADGNAARIFPSRIDRRTLGSWGREPRVWMRCLCARLFRNLRSPLLPLPIKTFRWRRIRHAFPPDTAIWSQRDVRENGVFRERGHRIAIRLYRSARRHSEKSCFRIYRSQKAAFVRTNPGNVITHCPDLPSIKSLWRDEHRKICFSACARKSRGHVRFLARRIFHAKNQHVFRHPTLVPRDVGSDSQSKTLFTEQRVPAVARAV